MAADFKALIADFPPGLLPVSEAALQLDQLSRPIIGDAYLGRLSAAAAALYGGEWQSCVRVCELLLSAGWEHLNTGHWSEVPLAWRHAYSYASLLKAVAEHALWREHPESSPAAVATCDMGLLMGAPILDDLLSRLVPALQALQGGVAEAGPRLQLRPSVPPPAVSAARHVAVLRCPSILHLQRDHVATTTPVLITDAMHGWPALRRWDVDYIRRVAGHRTVPVELGSKYTDDAWSQTLMTVAEFIDDYVCRQDAPLAYLAQHELFEQVTELAADVVTPSYCGLGEDGHVDVNAWFGPPATVSPLHTDPKHNLLCQVFGEKYLRLYAPEHTAALYPHDGRLLGNTSRVDIGHVDADAFPLFSGAPYTECVLRPGQMLYLPPEHWHYVQALSTSFSVSFWWK